MGRDFGPRCGSSRRLCHHSIACTSQYFAVLIRQYTAQKESRNAWCSVRSDPYSDPALLVYFNATRRNGSSIRACCLCTEKILLWSLSTTTGSSAHVLIVAKSMTPTIALDKGQPRRWPRGKSANAVPDTLAGSSKMLVKQCMFS